MVIAIISILASMLLPALRSARTSAKCIQCVNKQKQIMLALILYHTDHGGYYPPYQTTTGGAGLDIPNVYVQGGYWHRGLIELKYVTMPNFVCMNLHPDISYRQVNKYGNPSFYIDYGYNYGGIGGSALVHGNNGRYLKPANVNEIKRPSQVYVTMDSRKNTATVECGLLTVYWSLLDGAGMPNAGRHKSVVNVSYGDGSVRGIKANPQNPYLVMKSETGSVHHFCWTGGRRGDEIE